jgi:hypothetical protein
MSTRTATGFTASCGLLVFVNCGTPAAAGDCWVDLYDKPDFQGAHVHLEGPLEAPNLKDLKGADWSNRIESLAVGPKAELLAYKQMDFNEEHQGQVYHPDALRAWGEKELPALHDLEITFGPGKKEHHLGELRFHQTLNSMKLRCR